MKRALYLLLILAACKSEEAKKEAKKDRVADVMKQEVKEKIYAGVGLPLEHFSGNIALIEETTVDEIMYDDHTRHDTSRVNYVFKDNQLHLVAINKRKPDTIVINHDASGNIISILKTDDWKPYLATQLTYDADGRCISSKGHFYSIGIGMSFTYGKAGDSIYTFDANRNRNEIMAFKQQGDTLVVEEKIATQHGYLLNAVKKYNEAAVKTENMSYVYEDETDTVGYRETARYDKYGNVVEKTTSHRPGNNIFEYTYDKKGNWTMRKQLPKNKREGWLSLTTRKISYR